MARRCSRRNVPHDEVDDDEEDVEISVLSRKRRSTRRITVSTDEDEEEEEEEGRRRSTRVRRQAMKVASESHSEFTDTEDDEEKSEEDDVQRRRSVRVHKQTKKVVSDFDSDDLLSSEDEDEDEEESGEEEEDGEKLHIEKILARKKASTDSDGEQNDEFLVKWKGLSHIHCSWKTRSEILDTKQFPGGKQRLNRFQQSMGSDEESNSESTDKKHEVSDLENGRYFPEDFCVVDRIVAHRPSSGRRVPRKDWPQLEFLVKWCLLGYECATWENWSTLERLDIEQTSPSIEQYFRFVEPREPQVSGRGGKKFSKRKCRGKVASSSRARGHNQSVAVDFANLDFPAECSLRDYQIEGVKWLSFNWMQNRNSILADEMGLGKTVQVAAFTAHLFRNNGVPGPFLVVAPLSTLQHWRREFETWVPYLNSVVYHGGAQARETIRQYEFRFDKKLATKSYKFDVLITSYEMCLTDAGRLKHISWDALFVDESHRLKNISSRIFQELVRFRRNHCVFLTGTPIQNSLEELWTLLHFLDNETFKSGSEFLERFGDLKEKKDVDELHSILKPYFLRRMKGDVEKDLPSRQEIVIDVEMTVLQKKLYKAVYERNTKFLIQKTTMPSLMNIGMQLRKCCNHPYLLRGVEDAQLTENATDEEKMNLLINSSGKFVLLDKLLPKLAREGHRVLIFSQMVRMLDIIEDYLHYRRILYERIDGGIRGAARQKAIDNFTNNPLVFVFMLATRAGGVGINLTAADTVIIFDSDWNPQNDLQAQARCHRIGQTQEVKVYRLVTKNTYEGVMFERASMKLGLDLAVLHPMTRQPQSGGSERLNKDDIEALLKHGAYHFVDDASDAKSRQFCDQDIDEILANASRTIEQSSASATGSTFAKANFVISAPGGLQLDINDPDFWSKVGLSYEEENEMLQLEPRKRRRVLRFGSYSGMQDGRGHVSRDEKDDDWSGPGSAHDGHSSTSGDDEFDVDADGSMPLQQRHKSDSKNAQTWTWKLTDRDRFFATLLMFGFGRWQVIAEYEAANARGGGTRSKRSTDEMRLFALGLVHKCVVAANADTIKERGLPWLRRQAPLFLESSLLRRELTTCLKLCNIDWSGTEPCMSAADDQAALEQAPPASAIESIIAGLKLVPLDGSLCSARFDISLRKKARTSLSALERMYTLQASCAKLSPGVEPDWGVVGAEACKSLSSHQPTPWWTQVHDSALLEGTWYCGQGNYRLLNQRQSSSLFGKIFPPSFKQETANEAEPTVYPSVKSLTFRLRSLITNLYRRLLSSPPRKPKRLPSSRASNGAVNAPAELQSTSQHYPYQHFQQLLLQQQAFEQQQQAQVYEQLRQQQQYYMAYQPQLPFGGQQLSVYEPHQQQQMNQPASFMPHQQLASAAQFHPQQQQQQLLTSALETVQQQQQQQQQEHEQQPEVRQLSLSQFSEEYRLLLSMSEELLTLYPSQLMPVLQKANYLMAQFALKEGEANLLGQRFEHLQDCFTILAENARELSTLFRRVRRRVNKCCRIRQLVSAWATANGVSDVSSVQLPPELAEKQSAEKDLLMRTSDCLGSVARLTLRIGLILQRVELSGHT